jgi:hypothetical protein
MERRPDLGQGRILAGAESIADEETLRMNGSKQYGQKR